MVPWMAILLTAFRITLIRNGYAEIIFNTRQILSSVKNPHENLFMLAFWHLGVLMILFNFRLRVPKNKMKTKKCKIFENFQRPKMSQNVQFLVSNCENNVLHTWTLVQIPQETSLSRDRMSHDTYRFSASRGVTTTIFWSYLVYCPSSKRTCSTFKNLIMKQRGSASYIDKTWWYLWNVKL